MTHSVRAAGRTDVVQTSSQPLEGPGSEPGSGLVVFASVMMVFTGLSQLMVGIVAMTNADYFDVVNSQLALHLSYTAWGVTMLAIAVLNVVCGVGLLLGWGWVRWVALFVACATAMAFFSFLRSNPIWSSIVIGSDVIIVWAICMHFDEMGQVS